MTPPLYFRLSLFLQIAFSKLEKRLTRLPDQTRRDGERKCHPKLRARRVPSAPPWLFLWVTYYWYTYLTLTWPLVKRRSAPRATCVRQQWYTPNVARNCPTGASPSAITNFKIVHFEFQTRSEIRGYVVFVANYSVEKHTPIFWVGFQIFDMTIFEGRPA
jgi:hypothetical protein